MFDFFFSLLLFFVLSLIFIHLIDFKKKGY